MNFFYVKQQLIDTLLEKYGTNKNFLLANPDIKMTESALSQALSPNKSCTLKTLLKLAEKLDLELIFKRKGIEMKKYMKNQLK